MNLSQKPGSSNLIGWKLEVGGILIYSAWQGLIFMLLHCLLMWVYGRDALTRVPVVSLVFHWFYSNLHIVVYQRISFLLLLADQSCSCDCHVISSHMTSQCLRYLKEKKKNFKRLARNMGIAGRIWLLALSTICIYLPSEVVKYLIARTLCFCIIIIIYSILHFYCVPQTGSWAHPHSYVPVTAEADEILIFLSIYFSEKIRLDIACECHASR